MHTPEAVSWAKGLRAITLFVEDMQTSKAFYQQIFAVPAIFDDAGIVTFNFGNVVVNLVGAEFAGSLIAPATLGQPGGGPRGVYTVGVDDVDATCAALTGRGVTLLNGPLTRPWGERSASFKDPSGNIWLLSQA